MGKPKKPADAADTATDTLDVTAPIDTAGTAATSSIDITAPQAGAVTIAPAADAGAPAEAEKAEPVLPMPSEGGSYTRCPNTGDLISNEDD